MRSANSSVLLQFSLPFCFQQSTERDRSRPVGWIILHWNYPLHLVIGIETFFPWRFDSRFRSGACFTYLHFQTSFKRNCLPMPLSVTRTMYHSQIGIVFDNECACRSTACLTDWHRSRTAKAKHSYAVLCMPLQCCEWKPSTSSSNEGKSKILNEFHLKLTFISWFTKIMCNSPARLCALRCVAFNRFCSYFENAR